MKWSWRIGRIAGIGSRFQFESQLVETKTKPRSVSTLGFTATSVFSPACHPPP